MTKNNEDLDALIISMMSNDWQKTSMVISKVFEDPAFKDDENLAQKVAQRIYIMVDSGKLESLGNMRRWRSSDVRLPQKNN